MCGRAAPAHRTRAWPANRWWGCRAQDRQQCPGWRLASVHRGRVERGTTPASSPLGWPHLAALSLFFLAFSLLLSLLSQTWRCSSIFPTTPFLVRLLTALPRRTPGQRGQLSYVAVFCTRTMLLSLILHFFLTASSSHTLGDGSPAAG